MRIVLALGLAIGCGKGSPDATGDPTGPTSPGSPSTGMFAGSTTGTPVGTPTGSTPTGGTTLPAELSCLPQSCGDAELGATANNGGSDYLPAVICALEALRDAGTGTDGQLRVGTFNDVETGRTLVIDGASREVLEQAFDGGAQGIPLTRTPVARCQLADAAWFQGCLDSPSLGCLDSDAWLASCVSEPTAPCP